MILNYQRYISKQDDISKTGIIIELLSSTYFELLEKHHINFEESYLLEEGSLISDYALVYYEVDEFPEKFQNKKVIKKFLSNIQICQVENGQLKLLRHYTLPDFLPFVKKQIKDFPVLSQSSRLSGTIDKRLPNQLSGKQNLITQINRGCGYSSDGMVCNDIECYSDYVWIENGICCVYFAGSLSGLTFVNFFPFKTDEEA